MAEVTRISSKGQLVVPRGIREALGIRPGDTLQIEVVGDLIVLKKIELPSLKEQLARGGRK